MIKWWSIPCSDRKIRFFFHRCSEIFDLQDGAAALFPKRVDFLAGEAHKQTVFLLMFRDILDDFGDCLSHRQSLDSRLATQLLRHHPKMSNKLIESFRRIKTTQLDSFNITMSKFHTLSNNLNLENFLQSIKTRAKKKEIFFQ